MQETMEKLKDCEYCEQKHDSRVICNWEYLFFKSKREYFIKRALIKIKLEPVMTGFDRA